VRRATYLLILAAASVLATGAAAAGLPEVDEAGLPLQCTAEGHYEGEGFAIDIPRRLHGCDGWPQALLIPLGEADESRYVIVEGSYDPELQSALAESVDTLIESFLGSADLVGGRLESRTKTWLGDDRAIRLEFSYFDAEGQPMRIVFVTPIEGSVHSLSLTTTADAYLEDLMVFERIRRSWLRVEEHGC